MTPVVVCWTHSDGRIVGWGSNLPRRLTVALLRDLATERMNAAMLDVWDCATSDHDATVHMGANLGWAQADLGQGLQGETSSAAHRRTSCLGSDHRAGCTCPARAYTAMVTAAPPATRRSMTRLGTLECTKLQLKGGRRRLGARGGLPAATGRTRLAAAAVRPAAGASGKCEMLTPPPAPHGAAHGGAMLRPGARARTSWRPTSRVTAPGCRSEGRQTATRGPPRQRLRLSAWRP